MDVTGRTLMFDVIYITMVEIQKAMAEIQKAMADVW